jgi:hypothetical protein
MRVAIAMATELVLLLSLGGTGTATVAARGSCVVVNPVDYFCSTLDTSDPAIHHTVVAPNRSEYRVYACYQSIGEICEFAVHGYTSPVPTSGRVIINNPFAQRPYRFVLYVFGPGIGILRPTA